MEQHRKHTDLLEENCRLLVEAIVRRAAGDYLAAMRRKRSRKSAARMREVAGFFRSDYFRRLTGADGELLLEKIRKEAERK